MSVTNTIRECWDELSWAAQRHIQETRPNLLRRWHLIEEGYHFDTVEADSLDEACELARERVEDSASCYDTSRGTVYADIVVRNAVTGEKDEITVTIEQDEPECDAGKHEWCSPFEVLGGIRENPGVRGHGGGVIIREVCSHCGMYRITDTWAQRRDTGQQGLTEVRYEDADERAREWLARVDQ